MLWYEWEELIQPCYDKGVRGSKPYDLELMMHIYVRQNLYNLSDTGTREAIIDSRAFSEFCHVESRNQMPDSDTIGRFRNLLIHNSIQKQFFALVTKALSRRGLMINKGTIIEAPSSTKNQERKRDPDAHSTKKGNTWHFGYKAHIGADAHSGLVHTVRVTAANIHDVEEVPNLLTGTEEAVYEDSGYLGAEKRENAILKNRDRKRVKYKINRRPSQYRKNSNRSKGQIRRIEHDKSSVRAKGDTFSQL